MEKYRDSALVSLATPWTECDKNLPFPEGEDCKAHCGMDSEVPVGALLILLVDPRTCSHQTLWYIGEVFLPREVAGIMDFEDTTSIVQRKVKVNGNMIIVSFGTHADLYNLDHPRVGPATLPLDSSHCLPFGYGAMGAEKTFLRYFALNPRLRRGRGQRYKTLRPIN